MATRLSTLLNEAPSLRALGDQLKRIGELHQVYSDAVPGSLLKASRVGYLDDTTLIIIAFNGATAASLKQRLPSLLARIRQRQPQVTGLSIEVQVEEIDTFPTKKGLQRHLSAGSSSHLNRFADGLEASPLKQALTRLAGRTGLNQDQSFDDVEEGNGGKENDKKTE